MKNARWFAISASFFASLAVAAPVRGGGFVIVVNPANGVTSLSRSELKRLVTGGIKQWDSGAVVQLGVIPSDAPETQYLSSLLDMTPHELVARLQEQVFKGEIRRPVTLRSSADCVAYGRSNPGALCVASDGEPGLAGLHVVAVH